ncbi:MAG: family 10 glycosylhydrolase, partial [Clostridia bacterium]|nr:family 10 glycosylhydrolase [Clostridia bacterium]
MSRVKSENAARPRRGSGPSKRPVSVLTAAFLSVLLLFSALPATNASAEGTSSHALNGFNVTRGTDQMVVYDQGETTNTNEWGYEVTVSAEGIVTKIGGNNSPIPEGGFVVSGHGTSASWLKTIVRVGMYCFANQYANAVLFSREPIEKTYSFELVPTGTNTTRITDALILYTPAWGSNTRTNEWGYEVSVSAEGLVTELGGNNHAIPAGGFVLSAHGDSIEKLTNLFYEEKVEYDPVRNVLTVTYDGRCAFGQSARAFRTISDRYASEKMSGRMGDYERAKAVIEEADAVIRNTDRDDSESCFEAERVLTGLTAELTSAFSESIGGEYRGAWVRPVETTREQVAAQVQKMKDAGINMIALEILYGEGVVFPTPEGCPYRQLDRFGGFDVLEAYVEECHLRQMELHAWCPNMFCGNTEEKGVPKEHPDWLVKDNRGRTGAETEYEVMYFINPFCKEATDALLDMYRYLFTT